MSSENSKFRLELGQNNFVPMVGEIKIIDRANDGGKTASVTIKLRRDQLLPAENTQAFITRLEGNGSRTKLFGGRMPATPELFQISGSKHSITFNNYTDLLELETIEGYRESTTIRGHIELAGIRSGAYVPGAAFQAVDVRVGTFENDDPFLFEQDGVSYRQFLENIVKAKNASWTLRDSGAPSISTQTALSRLIVRENTTLLNPAPIAELNADEIDPCKIFWLKESLSQERIPPQYSVIWVEGRFGKLRPSNEILSRSDYKRIGATANTTSYELLNLGDELLQIRITKPDMTTYNLTLKDYNEWVKLYGEPSPTNPQPQPGSRIALIRTDTTPPCFYCDPTIDVQGGYTIEQFYVTRYIFYELVNQAAINIRKQADRNATIGRKVFRITDESITDLVVAQQRAEAAEPGLCSTNYKIKFKTLIEGFQALDQFFYRRASRNILALMSVTGVTNTYSAGGRYLAEVEAATVIFDNPMDAMIRRFRKLDNPTKPRQLLFSDT